ncbi:MAG TPA: twin-arginine translocase TatA/TatE family subunit [Polyangia bacterium]|nr:twin-arginine translocase TatA/TatE family subunit [Polyangia bacterium]
MPGIGPFELILILLIVLIVFGAGKLPQIGDALGRSIKNFKRATQASDEIDVTPKKAELDEKAEKEKEAAKK